MTDTKILNRQTLRAQPRIDESKVAKPLQDLFAGWRISLKEPFKGLTATGEIERGLFARHKTGVLAAPLIDAAKALLSSLVATQHAAVRYDVDGEVWRH